MAVVDALHELIDEKSKEMADSLERLAPMWIGICLSLLTLLFGFRLGSAFGVREDAMKESLARDTEAVFESRYSGDIAAMKKVTDRALVYHKRAHLHANGLGTSSLVMILLLAALLATARVKSATALSLGVGSLGYSLFWLLAGLRAPGLGSTGAAKESLHWLAVPTSDLCILGLVAVLILSIRSRAQFVRDKHRPVEILCT